MNKFLFKKFLILLLLAIIATPSAVFGATLELRENYILPDTQTIEDNLYIGASELLISGFIRGDLIVGAGNVSQAGNVNEDALIAAGTIHNTGNIRGDLRVLTGKLILTGIIGGDLAAISANSQILPQANITGDFILVGETVDLEGIVAGNVKIFANKVRISGTIFKNAEINAKNLVLEKTAVIEGDLIYTGPKNATIESGAQINGEIIYQKFNYDKYGWKEFGKVNNLAQMLMAILIGLLALWLANKKAKALVSRSLSRFGKDFLIGIILAFLLPIAAVIALITIIGLPIGFLIILHYCLFGVLAWSFSGIIFGVWTGRVIFKKKDYNLDFKAVIFGIIGLRLIVSVIPVFGWLIGLIFTALAFGSLFSLYYKKFLKEKN